LIKQNLHIEASYSVKDDRFTIDQIPDSQLLVEISDSFLHFAILDGRQRFMWLEDFPLYPQSMMSRIKQLFNEHPMLSVRFWKQVKILVHSKKKCFVPSDVTGEKQAIQILQILVGSEPENTLISKTENGLFVYEVEQELISFLNEFYQEEKPEIDLAESGFKENTLIFHQSGVTLFLANQGMNSYFSSSFDKVISLLKENGIQNFKVCGEVTAYAKEFKQLATQFSSVILADQLLDYTFSQYFQDCPMHRYYLLFSALR
jgi:hypothetical protein